MIRHEHGETFWLAVISGNRPEATGPTTALLGAASWYVTGEATPYAAALNALARDNHRSDLRPCGDPYPANRQLAMDDAWRKTLPCVEVDDDLRSVKRVLWDGAFAATEPCEPIWAISELVRRVRESPYRMGGAAPTTNAYFARQEPPTHLFVRSGVRVTFPEPEGAAFMPGSSHPRVDTTLRLKHDYDFTIQHWLAYGGALRCDDLLFDFQQVTNRGGVQDYRTADAKEAAVRALLEKWPGYVKRHATRDGEVTLTLPRPR